MDVDIPFPFGLPAATAFYLVLFLLTLMIHIVFMNYVLAGSAYLAAFTVCYGNAEESRIVAILRDWMPFMLSAAITAGIAPLLFLQVLYKEQFYTANLLLFHRWLAILPALIAGFYLLYLLKSKFVPQWPFAARAAVGCGAFACFGFVGWSWVENHLLSVQPHIWPEHYASAAILFQSPELIPRLLLWFTAAFPTLALCVGWQLWAFQAGTDLSAPDNKSQKADPDSRQVCRIGLAGLAVSSVTAIVYTAFMGEDARAALAAPVGLPYVILATAGTIVQLAAWARLLAMPRLTRTWLAIVTAGLAINFVGMAGANESARLASLDMEALYAVHQKATEVGGFPVFVFFFIVNTALMFYCVRLVRRNARRE